MRKTSLGFIVGLSLALTFSVAQSAPKIVNLSCNVGPVEKTFGESKWQVYGCSDTKSLAFVAEKNSPAAPFTFTLAYTGNGYDLRGNGTGDRKVTDAAYADLQKLTGEKVNQLLRETSTSKPKK